ncbi:MAG: 30S ribosomal protein S6 [Candidatus Daviesbacteria bacterium]|nr:30S ribosomal protein S6 [Candidatus Daviesbacteria bacterium]
MNSYYLTLVLKPDLEEKERKTLLDSVKAKLVPGSEKTTSADSRRPKPMASDEASVVKEDLWGVRALAYPINKQTSGYYAHFEIQADPKDAKGLDKSLKVEEDILRYLLVRK